MDIKPDTTLNGNLNIIKKLDKHDDYFLYSVLSTHDGNIYNVVEYFPEEGVRDDQGTVIIPYETIKEFDTCVNNFMTNIDIVISLEINSCLKVVDSFNQLGTAFVVTEQIEGSSFEQFLEKKRAPLTINEATPMFLEFLRIVSEASSNGIYFHINPKTVFVTNDGDIRLQYYFAHNYEEKTTITDMAKLYYFMLKGTEFSNDLSENFLETEGLSEIHRELIDTLIKECHEENYSSMKAFYDELLLIYEDKKIRANKPAIKAKKITLKSAMLTILFIIAFVFVIAISSFFISKMIIGDPFVTSKGIISSGSLKTVFLK